MDKTDIITAGLELLQIHGLSGLTTRRLADLLQVQGPALYHHYRNKEALLGDMANAMVETALDALPSCENWIDWNIAFSTRVRREVLRYRDGALLLIKAWPTHAMRHQTIPRLEQPMLDAGFSEQVAHEVQFGLASFTIGWVLNEQNPRIAEMIVESMDPDVAFDRGLRTFLAGVPAAHCPAQGNFMAAHDK